MQDQSLTFDPLDLIIVKAALTSLITTIDFYGDLSVHVGQGLRKDAIALQERLKAAGY